MHLLPPPPCVPIGGADVGGARAPDTCDEHAIRHELRFLLYNIDIPIYALSSVHVVRVVGDGKEGDARRDTGAFTRASTFYSRAARYE